MTLLRAVQHVAWSYHAGNFLQAVQGVSPVHRLIVLLVAGVVTSAGLALIRRFTPDGPGLMAGLWFHAGRFALVRTFAHAIMSIVIVGLGASLGREAAPKDVAAIVASFLSTRLRLTSGQRRSLVACAAGAGMAAVYNVPFGGALFSLEVLLGTLALPLVLPALVTSVIATAVARIALPSQPSFTIPTYGVTESEIVWAVLFGPVAGIGGVAFVRVIRWASGIKPRGTWRVVLPIGVFALLGVASIVFPQVLGNGKNIVQLAFVDQLGLALIAALLVLKLAATAGCLGTGAPGGLFMPTMAFGALFGALCGYPWEHAWPTHEAGSYAIIGAGALLAAATQGPVSAIAFILELTSNAGGLILPIMLAVAESTVVARWFGSRSMYSARIAAQTLACTPSAPIETAFDELVTHDYMSISAATPLGTALLAHRVGVLYVVDEHDRLVGAIDAEAVNDAPPAPFDLPLATMTAGDVAAIVPFVVTNMSRDNVIAQLNAAGRPVLPLVDARTGALVGMVDRNVLARARESAARPSVPQR
jgi:H+/Cl- antiporter ClcA